MPSLKRCVLFLKQLELIRILKVFSLSPLSHRNCLYTTYLQQQMHFETYTMPQQLDHIQTT